MEAPAVYFKIHRLLKQSKKPLLPGIFREKREAALHEPTAAGRGMGRYTAHHYGGNGSVTYAQSKGPAMDGGKYMPGFLSYSGKTGLKALGKEPIAKGIAVAKALLPELVQGGYISDIRSAG